MGRERYGKAEEGDGKDGWGRSAMWLDLRGTIT